MICFSTALAGRSSAHRQFSRPLANAERIRMSFQRFNYFAKKFSELTKRDFCPWVNPYVYWLKEPVGWFVLALIASVLVGVFLSPLGWSVAAGLATLIALGLGFPWLATRCVRCRVRPVDWELRERQDSYLDFTVANYLPLPVTGLKVEGYVSLPSERDDANTLADHKDCVLALVPAFSRATYRLPLRPEYRGRYPVAAPQITCAFPFGIWTARRVVEDVTPILVRPLLIPIESDIERVGSEWADHGLGSRPASQGDFQGVRDFRDGDSLKSIHWAQSARNDRLVVCERGGPQQQTIDVQLSTARIQGTKHCARENLAWRVRVAASLTELLCARHIPFRLWIDEQPISLPTGSESARRARELLADIPLDGIEVSPSCTQWSEPTSPTIRIHASDEHGFSLSPRYLRLDLIARGTSLVTAWQAQQDCWQQLINLDLDIASQLNQFLSEADRASIVA